MLFRSVNPKTPEQIANAAIEAAKAGAAIAHIHVRENDGTPSRRLELYKEALLQSFNQPEIRVTQGPGGGPGGAHTIHNILLCVFHDTQ